jgi:hypothetical protein
VGPELPAATKTVLVGFQIFCRAAASRSDILWVPQEKQMSVSGNPRPVIQVSGIRKTYGLTPYPPPHA